MRCKATRNVLSSYIEGELSETERRRMAAHLGSCDRCTAEVEALKKTLTLLRWIPHVEGDPDFVAGVMERIRAEQARPSLFVRLREMWAGFVDSIPVPRLEVNAPATAVLLILAMSVSVWATLLAVDAPLQSADSPRVATGEPTGTRDIEEARATTPPLLRPRESSARQLPATTPVVYGQRGGTAFPDAFLRREASSGRPQGPASIGRVEYVLPQLRPLPSQTQPQGRPLPAGTHVDENGYVIF